LDVFHVSHQQRLQDLEGAPLASFKARAAAFSLDFAITAVLYIAVALPLQYWNWMRHGAGGTLMIRFEGFHHLWNLVALVLYFALTTWWGKGQTLGKRLFRIRVVSLVHGHLGFWHCVERALGYGASTLELGFGFLQYFIHPNRQTVHDRIAETIVVRVGLTAK